MAPGGKYVDVIVKQYMDAHPDALARMYGFANTADPSFLDGLVLEVFVDL
jgi:hypothetical protein